MKNPLATIFEFFGINNLSQKMDFLLELGELTPSERVELLVGIVLTKSPSEPKMAQAA